MNIRSPGIGSAAKNTSFRRILSGKPQRIATFATILGGKMRLLRTDGMTHE